MVAGPFIIAAPVISTPGLLVPEHPQKRRRVTDLEERELMLANFKDWWASGRSTPQPGLSSALQRQLVTPPVVLVPSPSSALAIPAAVALSTSSWSVASSSRSVVRQRSGIFPDPVELLLLQPCWIHLRGASSPVPLPVTRPEAVYSHGTRHPSGVRHRTQDPSASWSQSRSHTRHSS